MGRQSKFESALETLKKMASDTSGSDEVYEAFSRAEEFILDSFPTTTNEAAAMLEIILENIVAGPRSDGRDAYALRSIISWLNSTSTLNVKEETGVLT